MSLQSAGLLLLLSLPAFAAKEPPPPSALPQPQQREPREVDAQRQNTLVEMWQRKILPAESQTYSPDDLALLERIRKAESHGAIELLKEKGHPLRDFVAVKKRAAFSDVRLRLTQAGFSRYQQVLAQEAIAYFQSKDVDAKWAFKLMDINDRPLFDPKGLLTEAGEDLYQRAKAGDEVQWKNSAGAISGSGRPGGPSTEVLENP